METSVGAPHARVFGERGADARAQIVQVSWGGGGGGERLEEYSRNARPRRPLDRRPEPLSRITPRSNV